jgi:predicted kinase
LSNKIIGKETIFPPPYLETYGLKVIKEVREKGTWYKFDLLDGVQVLALDEDGNVIAIRQERNGIPYLGLVGETMTEIEQSFFRKAVEEGQSAVIVKIACEVAVRGLLEETGYEAGKLKFLASGLVHSGKGIPSYIFVLARNCRKVREPEEGIKVELWSPQEFFLALKAQFLSWPAIPRAGANSLIATALALSLGLSVQSAPGEFRGTPTVVAVRGLPLSGKTTLGRALSEKLGWHFIDVDYCRRLGVGDPEREKDANPFAAGEVRKQKESEDMRIAYTLMHEAVRANIALGRSVICDATYSSRSAQKFLLEIIRAHPGAKLKGIRCVFNDTEEEIRRRIDSISRDKEGGCKTVGHYLTDKNQRHDYTDLWGVLEVNTNNPLEDCVKRALEFINS